LLSSSSTLRGALCDISIGERHRSVAREQLHHKMFDSPLVGGDGGYAFHRKSHDTAAIRQKRQPLTGAFRESEHLGIYYGHSTSTGAPKAFDGVVLVEPGIFGPSTAQSGLTSWNRDMRRCGSGMWVSVITSAVSIRDKSFREMAVHRW
jgi:hypothetical protein